MTMPRPVAAGLAVLALLTLLVVVGPFLVDADPLRTAAGPANSTLGTPGHPLGTDSLGRDLLARVLAGGRTSLLVGVLVASIALTIGTIIGCVAGLGPSWLDSATMRTVDAMTTVPFLVMVLALRAVLAPGLWSTVVVLAAFMWFPIARVVRAQLLTLRERTYVKAAVVAGESPGQILWRHLVPNALPPVLAVVSLVTAEAIIAETTLSWLNLGVPQSTPTWGNILVDAQREVFAGNWWSLLVPGLGIAATISAVGAVAGGFRTNAWMQ